jgi:hypothetical protein
MKKKDDGAEGPVDGAIELTHIQVRSVEQLFGRLVVEAGGPVDEASLYFLSGPSTFITIIADHGLSCILLLTLRFTVCSCWSS